MGKNNSHATCGQNMKHSLKIHSQTFMHNSGESKDQTKPKKATKSIEIIIEEFFSFVFLSFLFTNNAN